ncbi:MAG: HU family DNA-binding protein [Coxiellaceae bacterium]|nr:HU family DNA-binding protein [Coxiellaceae bacterium]
MPKKTKKSKKVTSKIAKKVIMKCKPCIRSVKVSEPFNKSKIVTSIAEMTCLSKKETSLMLDSLFEIMASHLRKRSGVGEFTLPGIAKFRVVNKPATKAHHGINPFTGESMMFAAKPARNVIKIRALKKIKDIAK